MCETNTCVCRYFLFALKPYTGIYSFRQSKQNSKAKHLCSALKLYPNIFFILFIPSPSLEKQYLCTSIIHYSDYLHNNNLPCRYYIIVYMPISVINRFFRTFCHNIRRRCNRLQLFHCFAKQTYSKSQYTYNTQ